MTPLTEDEVHFLVLHALEPDDVHDGRGQSKRTREAEDGKTLILASSCRVGHRLKTRSGHCAQCNPINIAFQDRHNSYGHVYIAGSLSGRIIKFGNAGTIEQREPASGGKIWGPKRLESPISRKGERTGES
jgi:hypothetical protein